MADNNENETKVLTAELPNLAESEVSPEDKALEVAGELIAKKFAGTDRVISTVELAGALAAAEVPGVTIDTAANVLKIFASQGHVKPLVQMSGGRSPLSWTVLSAPTIHSEQGSGVVPIEVDPVTIDIAAVTKPKETKRGEEAPARTEAAAEDPQELLRRARLAALEKYIESLGQGVEFTGKNVQTALKTDELENPSHVKIVALLAELEKNGKVKHLGGDRYALVSERSEPRDVVGAIKKKMAEGEFRTDTQILDILAEHLTDITPAILRDELAAAGVTMSLTDVESTIFPALAAQGLITETLPGAWVVDVKVLSEQQGVKKEGKPVEAKPEVKNGKETFEKMVEALAAVKEVTDVEGVRVAFQAAGLAGTMGEVLLAMPGLVAEGLIKEDVAAGTWIVNKAEVAKRQNPAEVESVTVETDAEKLAQARLQAVEEYINTQADAGGEITQAGALAMLEADAAMGEVTDMDVFKIFEDFEKAGKIKFISRGRYERVVQEDEEDAVGDTEAKKQELFEARLFVLESFVEKAAESGEDITITSVKAALEAEGDLGTDIPEAEIEALLAKLVDNGTIRVQTDGKYEVVTEAEDESDEAGAETFTSEQLAVAHRWLRRAINRPGVKFIDVVTLARALAEAGQGGLDTAGSVALLGKLAADGLIAPFLTDSENSARNAWKINPEAVRALIAEEDETERESATDFYERTGASKNDLVAFARDVLRLPHMTAGIVEDRYTGEQLQAILDEYTKSLNQGRNYRVPSTTAWDAFPDEDLLGEEEVDEEEPEEEPEEEKPGLLGRIFGKKKSKKPVRAERPGVETSDSADIAAWKVSRRGKSFINSLAELNGDLALGGQDFFDQDNETDIEQAMIAQEMFDTHYAKVHTIFDRQLEAMTGYSMYDIFNLGPEGEKMYEDFGKWVVRQAYLDAGTPQGRGRLEKIISLDVQAQENASFLATVVSTERLQELRDRRDDWKTAYKITRITSGDARDARDRLGKAVPTSWFAEVKGIRTARRYEEYVREVEEDYNQAPQVKAEIAKQREQIIAELDSMNGLLDAEGDKTSPASGFAKMLRSMIDKIGSTEKPTTGEVTPTEREQAEQAEQVLQAVKKVQAQREQIGASAFAFYDEQEQNKAGLEILRLEARVTKLIQQEFAKALEGKIAAGRAKGIVDFRAETLAMVERLAGNLTGSKARRNATAALAKVLEEKTKSFAKTEPKGAQLEVLKELEKSIALLNKRMKS